MNVMHMQIYTPMSQMRSNHRRYLVRLLQKSYTLRYVCEVSIESMLALMTDKMSEGSGEHVHLRNLVRVSLLTTIKLEVDEDTGQIKF